MSSSTLTFDGKTHIHIVGIGGSGMSAIALVLLGRGCRVTGSDLQGSQYTQMLRDKGVQVDEDHHADHIQGANALLVSSAIPEENVELIAARSASIPVLSRGDMLGQLMAGKTGIAVAGSHGKTTTTSLIGRILLEAGADPTVVVGGFVDEWGGNGRFGQGDHFVVEADEYDHMFLGLRPVIAVVTNIEHDHPDIFPTADSYQDAFRQFAGRLPASGRLVVSGEDPGVSDMLANLPFGDVIRYGIAGEANSQSLDLVADQVRPNQLGGHDFLVLHRGNTVGLMRLRLPGLHNVQNALAAIAVALDLEVPVYAIRNALADFGGVGRRFQMIGEVRGVTIIDDYAHHPTEIRATLTAARQRYGKRRIWAIWQPHTYSRTKLLLQQFANSFDDADRVIALDIYRSRESDTLGLNTPQVVEAMDHESVTYVGAKEETIAYLLDRIRPDDVLLTLGAGDGDLVGQGVLEALRTRVQSLGSQQ